MAKPGPKPGAKTTKAAKSPKASPPSVLATEAPTTPPADTPAPASEPVATTTPADAASTPADPPVPGDAPLVTTPEGDQGPAGDTEPDAKKAKPAAKKAAKVEAPALSASDRENFDKLSGQPLRDLANRRGIAFSTLSNMSDEKIRTQLRYIVYRQYEDSNAVD